MKKLILLALSIVIFSSCEKEEEQFIQEESTIDQGIVSEEADTKSSSLSHLFYNGDFEVKVADYNRDGYDDLWGIKVRNTRAGYYEVHILDGRSGYSRYLLRRGTILKERGQDYSFELGDYNRDRRVDLWAFRRSGAGTKRLEVHILDGVTNFTSWMTNRVTPHKELTVDQYAFPADYNNDGWLDVIIMDDLNWPYADVLNGKVRFSSYLAKQVVYSN